MGRRCSHCGNIGHNSRTCTTLRGTTNTSGGRGGLRLFGVQLQLDIPSSVAVNHMKKSFSMDCLSSSSASPSPSSLSSSRVSVDENSDKISIGYLSDGGRFPERKKGAPWTEEEHRLFLVGLEKLGKGDWRGISRDYVTTRTPTQVASHAQKYFLRQAKLDKKNRRSSLFDMVRSSSMAGPPPSLATPRFDSDRHRHHHRHPMPVDDSPELELTLASPRPALEENKSSQSTLLISVT
ncbi:Bacterial transferase hexapeptide repeat-containing protein isoform 1 [Hibiscus syriacus]|uniref:Bacterial transferase hexapeptide repeat-containing protein isoform 1 n=2 Tax=Hibiscus syriacus TaxID=106335 RepID=A0A6A3D1F0_HIBSY|nr:Bacterial transferase hexapeptide repeat-containing protein isoform 1 [Hibiscus syriacus]